MLEITLDFRCYLSCTKHLENNVVFFCNSRLLMAALLTLFHEIIIVLDFLSLFSKTRHNGYTFGLQLNSEIILNIIYLLPLVSADRYG